MELNNEKLDFISALKKHYPEFILDDKAIVVARKLDMWARRDPKFEKQQGDYLDKGICLFGPVGGGKTEMMRMLRRYIGYIKSQYAYGYNIVWKFAEEFKELGYKCFADQDKGNMYYDELCLLDDIAGTPMKETVAHYGDKTLVGSHLILMRYEVFKNTGWQSHFSTNCTPDQLKSAYGERAFSRLTEMVNFIPYLGSDRREMCRPIFLANKNNPQAPKSREMTQDEILENKKRLNAEYKAFCKDGALSDLAMFDYIILVNYGIQVASEEELIAIMDGVQQIPTQKLNESLKSQGSHVSKLFSGNLSDKERNVLIWEKTRSIAVMNLYTNMKTEGKEQLFEI